MRLRALLRRRHEVSADAARQHRESKKIISQSTIVNAAPTCRTAEAGAAARGWRSSRLSRPASSVVRRWQRPCAKRTNGSCASSPRAKPLQVVPDDNSPEHRAAAQASDSAARPDEAQPASGLAAPPGSEPHEDIEGFIPSLKLEREIAALFPAGTTLEDVVKMEPSTKGAGCRRASAFGPRPARRPVTPSASTRRQPRAPAPAFPPCAPSRQPSCAEQAAAARVRCMAPYAGVPLPHSSAGMPCAGAPCLGRPAAALVSRSPSARLPLPLPFPGAAAS